MKYERPNDGLNAIKRYQAKCDTITIRPLKEKGEQIREAADRDEVSITQYILKAIEFYEQNRGES